MLSFFLALICITLISIQSPICSCSFTTGSSTLFTPNHQMAVGYDIINDTILLLGGAKNGRQLTLFKNDLFIDKGDFLGLGDKTWGLSQQYTQINNQLWMIDKNGDGLVKFDTNTFDVQSPSTIPISVTSFGACLTSIDDYLIVIGGGGWSNPMKNVQIYRISHDLWLSNVPSLDTSRTSLSCAVVQDKVYAIGGYIGTSSSEEIEILDISNINTISSQTWDYLDETLNTGRDGTRAVVYGTDIYVIGGWDSDSIELNDVNVINTLTGQCTVVDTLSYATSFAASIIVRNTLFVFGGCKADALGNCDSDDRYQYSVFPTSNPTSYPTSTIAPIIPSTNSTSDVITLSSTDSTADSITTTITFTTTDNKNTKYTSSSNTDTTIEDRTSTSNIITTAQDTTASPNMDTTSSPNPGTTSSPNMATTTSNTDINTDTTPYTDTSPNVDTTTSNTDINMDTTPYTDTSAHETTLSLRTDTSAEETTSSNADTSIYDTSVRETTLSSDTDASAEEAVSGQKTSDIIIISSIVGGGVICCVLLFGAVFYMKKRNIYKAELKEEGHVPGQDAEVPQPPPVHPNNTQIIGELNGVAVVEALPLFSVSKGTLGSYNDMSIPGSPPGSAPGSVPGSIDMMPQSFNEDVNDNYIDILGSIPSANNQMKRKDDDIIAAVNRTAGERDSTEILGAINYMVQIEAKKNDDDIVDVINNMDNELKGDDDDDDDVLQAVNMTMGGNPFDDGDDDVIKAVNITMDGNPFDADYNEMKGDDDDVIKAVNIMDGNPFGGDYNDGDVLDAINRTNEGHLPDDNPFDVVEDVDDDAALPGQTTDLGKSTGENEEYYEFKIEGVGFDYDEDGANEVKTWLDSIGYGEYGDLFVRNGFDSMELIKQINAIDDLNGIGIVLRAHQLKIVNEIRKFKK